MTNWIKKRWAERSSQSGVALVAFGVIAIVFTPFVSFAAYAAIIYGGYQIWKKG